MKTINLGKLGNLRIERVLVKIDYPVLFLCQNEKGKLFLFVEKESDEHHEQWVVINVNDDTINKMCRGELSIQKAFINVNVDKYFVVNHDYNNDSYSYTISKSMPAEVLTEGDDFVPILDNSESILESAKYLTLKADSPVLDFHLNPYSHKHSIKASLLAFVSNKVVSMFNSSTYKKKDDLMVEFEPGSFVLRFYSKSLDSLIPENSSISAFKTIANILSANNIDDISKEMVSNPKLINPARELINKLSKEKEDFDLFITDNSTLEEPLKKRVNIDHLAEINARIKKYTLQEKERIVKIGALRSYDSVTKTFKFEIEDNNVLVKGNWAKEFVDKKYVVHERYLATISVLEERYDGDISETKMKVYYKLIKLDKAQQ